MQAPDRRVCLISVPYHAGVADVGMGLGPSALLERHGLAEALPGNVETALVQPPDRTRAEVARTFEIARAVADRVRAARAQGRLPFVLAGNCNSCLGTVAGLGRGVGVVWLDAHADFDTPEDNLSGFLDVMGLATLTGACWQALRRSIHGFREVDEGDVILAGVRDLEPYQRSRLDASRVRALYGDALRARPPEALLEPELERLRERTGAVYLHVDLDVLDPSVGRANEYAAPGGLSREQVEQAIGLIGSRFEIVAAAMTAYDPEQDSDGGVARAAVGIARAVVKAA